MIDVNDSFIITSFFFFSFSFLLYPAWRLWFRSHLANGLKTLTSPYALCPLIQRLFADTSALASFDVIAEMWDSVSPVKDCNNGYIFTSVHTSVNNSVVKFLISLCLAIINPPLGQNRACCTLTLLYPGFFFVVDPMAPPI